MSGRGEWAGLLGSVQGCWVSGRGYMEVGGVVGKCAGLLGEWVG